MTVRGRPWAKLVVPSTGSMIQQVSGRLRSSRALFSEESGLGRQGCKAFFQECLHSDIGFRYEIDAPLMADSVGMGMIGADDGAAFLDDGKGLQGQW